MSGNSAVLRGCAHAIVGALVFAGLVAGTTEHGALTAQAATASTVTVGSTKVHLEQPSDPFLGQVTPTATAATQGMFGPQVRWPLIPLQAVLTASGRLVTFGAPTGVLAQRGLSYDDWNPALGSSSGAHTQTTSMHDYDSFCSGMTRLPDGRLIMIGGNSTMSTMIFDPNTQQQVPGRDLSDQRWYASTLRLTDDRILTVGGADYFNTSAYSTPSKTTGIALIPEIGSGTGAWTSLTGARSTLAFGPVDNRWWYPRMYNGPKGSVVGISVNRLWSLSTSGTGKVTDLGKLPLSIGISGSTVMYRPGQLLVAGGGQKRNADSVKATKAAVVVDLNGAKPVVTKVASMAYARNWGNLTALANGEVLMNGGQQVGNLTKAGNAVYRAEVWNPSRKTWRTVAAPQRIRSYHSVSLLMPSGAVFTGGGGIPGPEDNLNAEMYYPSYLFTKGADGVTRWANRPKITSIAGNLTYGGRISLGMGDRRTIQSASLISLASVTHSYNSDQRIVPLTIASQRNGSVSLNLPTSVNQLPPGSYTLQVTDRAGVPSPAQIVTVKRSGAGAVTIYEPTQATGGGQTGDTTNVGVVPLTVGSAVSLEPTNQWGFRVRNQGGTVSTGAVTSVDPVATRAAASFVVRDGLSGSGTVSFESVAQPGAYLRSRDGVMVVETDDGSGGDDFAASASFVAGAGQTGQFTSFHVQGTDADFVQQVGSAVRAEPSDGSDLDRRQATFAVRPALAQPDEVPAGDQLRVASASASDDTVAREPGEQAAVTVGGGDPSTEPSPTSSSCCHDTPGQTSCGC